MLEANRQSLPGTIREAKTLAESAEDRYRRARNELCEHIKTRSSVKSLAFA